MRQPSLTEHKLPSERVILSDMQTNAKQDCNVPSADNAVFCGYRDGGGMSGGKIKSFLPFRLSVLKKEKLSYIINSKQYMGVTLMQQYDIESRTIDLANYIIENKCTVRDAAKKFGISKSTVHKDITERLPRINHVLWEAAREILDENKQERHIRGGLATREKYLRQKMV